MKKENQEILNEAKSRFQQILEYTTRRNKFTEEADDQQQPQEFQQDDMNSAPMDGGQMLMGGGMNDGTPIDGSQMPPQGEQQDQFGNVENDNGEAQPPDGFNPQVPQDDMSNIPMNDGMDSGIQPEDDVIDVSDLTDSQEETQEDVDKLDAKFDKVMKYLGQFEELIKSNDNKINDLKAEFEKRNPTQVEKLSMQTANSYPFNQTPEEYWQNKEKTSNYSTEDDENGTKQGQYVITKNDIDGTVDWKNLRIYSLMKLEMIK